MCLNFNIYAVHIISDKSGIADSISRKQRQGFRLLAPAAGQLSIAVSTEFLNLLPAKCIGFGFFSIHHCEWIRLS